MDPVCGPGDFRTAGKRNFRTLSGSDGQDQVVIYLAKERAMKRLGANMTVFANNELVNELNKKLGEKNIKVLEKSIEKM